MVDIETMGKGPTAAIIQIGALTFCKRTGYIDRKFRADVSLQSSLQHGCHLDQDTVDWWRGRLLHQPNCQPLPTALLAFARWYAGYEQWGQAEIWCKGLAFDIPILDHAFKVCGHDSPWHYRTPRDIRTLKALAIERGFVVPPTPVASHDGLEDCVIQVPQVVDPYCFLLELS